MKPAVFLDRDGTLHPEPAGGFAIRPEQAEPFPEAPAALAALQQAGFTLVVVSNQSGIARRMFTAAQVEAFNAALAARFAAQGVRFAGFEYCPHGPDDGCACRKPLPGMVLNAARKHDLDLARSYVIGDRERDIVSGRAAGVRGVRLERDGRAKEPTVAEAVVRDLAEAARVVLAWHLDG